MSRSLLAVAGLLALALLSPPRAHAQIPSSSLDLSEELGVLGIVVGGAGALTLSAVLIAEAADKIGQGHGLYSGGAVLEFIWGSMLVLGGGALATFGSFFPAARADSFYLGAAGALALGAHFVAHGIWSLTDGNPNAPSPPKPVWVVPQVSADGAGILVGGTL